MRQNNGCLSTILLAMAGVGFCVVFAMVCAAVERLLRG